MKIINGSLIRDQNGDSPGRYGDSCFDTSAFALAYFYLRGEYHVGLNLDQFITPEGTIRHPLSPWREDDTTTDQELPLYMFMRETCTMAQATLIKTQAKERGWRTGNGQFVSPGYWAELNGSQFFRCLFLIIQVLFFWFPFYWNDGKWLKGEWPIGNAWKKSDGYLMWMLIAVQAPFFIRKLIRKKTLLAKIKAYYAPEPDSDWLVHNYGQVLERYF